MHPFIKISIFKFHSSTVNIFDTKKKGGGQKKKAAYHAYLIIDKAANSAAVLGQIKKAKDNNLSTQVLINTPANKLPCPATRCWVVM